MGKLFVRLLEAAITVAAAKGAEKGIEALIESLKKK